MTTPPPIPTYTSVRNTLPTSPSPVVNLAITPENTPAKAAQKNQKPIISPVRCSGASLVIADRPTGDVHSSPVVWNK